MFANGAQSGEEAAIRERVRALRRNVKWILGFHFGIRPWSLPFNGKRIIGAE
jgi:hypothetical protein